ncbi:MAG TPA: hypothetical protein DDW52_30395 [Planctomycetaceae bacterium]|nr:hypothetical protein [Planctomycetaceae bacterium]
MTTSAIKAGKAEVEVSLRDATQRGIRQVQNRLRALSRSFATVGASLTAAGAAAAATFGTVLSSAFTRPIQQAGEFAEVLSKFETVFAGQSASVRDWAQNFGKEVGRSEAQLLRFLGTAQDTFVPLGFDPAEAEEFSKVITQLAVDLGSFNNLDDGEAFDRLIGAVVGNTENLLKFGVVAQQAQIQAEALNLGFDPKNLTAYQKAQAILSLTIRGTEAAQGDAARTSGSYANQLKALNAEISNLQNAIGGALLGAATSVVSRIRQVVEAISAFASANPRIVQGLAVVAGALTGAGIAVAGFGVSLVAIGGVVGSISTIAGAIGGLVAVITPVGAAIAAVAVAGVAFQAAAAGAFVFVANRAGLVADAIEYIRGAFTSALAIVQQTFGGIANALSSGEIVLAARILWAGVRVAFLAGTQEVLRAVSSLWTNIGDITQRFSQAFLDSVGDVFSQIPRIIRAAITGGESIAQIIADAFTGNLTTGDGLLGRTLADARRELDELTAQAAKLGGNRSAQVELDERSADDAIAKLRAKLDSATPRDGDAIKRDEEARKAIADRTAALRQEIEVLQNGQEAANLLALAREGATRDELSVIASLQLRRATLEESKAAEDAAREAAQQRNAELQRDGESLADSLRTPLEKFRDDQRKVIELQRGGFISQEVAARAFAQNLIGLRGELAAEFTQNTIAERGSSAAQATIDATRDLVTRRQAVARAQDLAQANARRVQQAQPRQSEAERRLERIQTKQLQALQTVASKVSTPQVARIY